MTILEREANQLAADLLRVSASPSADFGPDGVDARIFAAKIEALGQRHKRNRTGKRREAV